MTGFSIKGQYSPSLVKKWPNSSTPKVNPSIRVLSYQIFIVSLKSLNSSYCYLKWCQAFEFKKMVIKISKRKLSWFLEGFSKHLWPVACIYTRVTFYNNENLSLEFWTLPLFIGGTQRLIPLLTRPQLETLHDEAQ